MMVMMDMDIMDLTDRNVIDVHMHTCHQHQGYGTFVSRDNVLRFIELMELDPIDIMQSDMYFTTFMNQVPYQLEGTAAVFPAYIDEEDREGRLIENKNNPNLTAAGRSHVVSKGRMQLFCFVI